MRYDYTPKFLARFWPRVYKTDTCWIWTDYTFGCGYGRITIRVDGKDVSLEAHRVSWELTRGPIPDGLCVLHNCDVYYPPGDIRYRRCVSPECLWLGTKADNSRDRNAKGRQARGDRAGQRRWPERYHWGERHPSAKLTDDRVREARARFRAGEGNYSSWGRELGITKRAAQEMLKGQTWKHVT